MKGFLALIALVIIVGGGWYFYKNSSPSVPAVPTTTDTMNTTESTTMETGAMETGTMPATETEPAVAKVFDLTGKMFAFSQNEIRVKKGDTVTVNFESTDGPHDWVVDAFNARTKQVQPGTKTSVTFVADKAGTFEYYCSVGQHRQNGMVGKLIVE